MTFPANYQAANLAGKDAEFEVTAKSVEAPAPVTLDDEFAKTLGMESLDKLKTAIKDRIAREHAAMSRQKLKRELLDKLDQMHKFAPPPTLVEDEFNNVWQVIESDLKQQGRTFADEGTTEEKAREEYRAIAERRVRLGLVLAEIGEKNNIKVTDDELSRAIVERARQMPGREQEIWEYYRKNPNAVAGHPGPDLRRESGRLPGRARQGDRQAGLPRGALQGRRGRKSPRRLIAAAGCVDDANRK